MKIYVVYRVYDPLKNRVGVGRGWELLKAFRSKVEADSFCEWQNGKRVHHEMLRVYELELDESENRQ